eukprot:3936462-Ditylum_brightwellii.AAC.2
MQKKEEKKNSPELKDSENDESNNKLSVLDVLPDCNVCISQGITSKVPFNGCMGCGMSFSLIAWNTLPPYGPPPGMCKGANGSLKA